MLSEWRESKKRWESATVIVKCYGKCAWIINGTPCAFLFTWQLRLPPPHSSGSNLFSNYHRLPKNRYYSVIRVVSCLSCDYYVEFIEQGGNCWMRALMFSFSPAILTMMKFLANLAASINIYVKQFCCQLECCFKPPAETRTEQRKSSRLSQHEGKYFLSYLIFGGGIISVFLQLCFLLLHRCEKCKQSVNFHLASRRASWVCFEQ